MSEAEYGVADLSPLPWVLTHGDLVEMNILVNKSTGALTGVIDWAEASILPFGFSLYCLENLLGWMDSRGWHFVDTADQLRNLFWTTFEGHIGRALSEEERRALAGARDMGIRKNYVNSPNYLKAWLTWSPLETSLTSS